MKITLEEAARIARLAHLRLTDEDLTRMRGQLDLILDYAGVLQTLPPESADPKAGALTGEDRPLREDKPIPSLDTEEALRAAPESGQGHFTVPRVIA
jgi:aspartyl-tRNA(Asn)/glutamyl-tRNA(Gln) amidotransferase subunit C